ncbi:uncharacterized protein LOC132705299 [Cylas formicarius]|uniref:uncharacterized protein LOC132705299 n=1 Tax=Cylas formicarius TaxID=197179 RepID=UPI0029584549|nr:uncharacterized protein LOC132705299 [Cylas formicarius]
MVKSQAIGKGILTSADMKPVLYCVLAFCLVLTPAIGRRHDNHDELAVFWEVLEAVSASLDYPSDWVAKIKHPLLVHDVPAVTLKELQLIGDIQIKAFIDIGKCYVDRFGEFLKDNEQALYKIAKKCHGDLLCVVNTVALKYENKIVELILASVKKLGVILIERIEVALEEVCETEFLITRKLLEILKAFSLIF